MREVSVSNAGMRIVKLLVGQEARTIADLTHETGVTRTAITEQLNELMVAGFVERTSERLSGRGRPRNRYSLTNNALVLLFGGNQQLVVPAMWRAIAELGGEEFSRAVMRRVSRAVAEHYRELITAGAPEDRLAQFAEVLRQEGVIVETSRENGQMVVRKRSCPFISMLDDGHAVCYVDQEVMTAVVGLPVVRTACRHDGDPCCKFAIDRNAD